MFQPGEFYSFIFWMNYNDNNWKPGGDRLLWPSSINSVQALLTLIDQNTLLLHLKWNIRGYKKSYMPLVHLD